MELQHFSDDHPLIFNKVKGAHCTCNGCDENIPDKDSCYSCRKCNVDLHLSCAELPRELQHPLHSKHPLILQKTPPYDEGTCTCKICGEPCKRRRFVYHCPLCKFDAHVKCVPISLQHFSDDHPLIFNKVKGAHCTCNGCDENISDKDSCYSCRECNVDLHLSCAELPRELQHPLHSKHPLILQKTPPYDEGTCTCKICGEPCKRRRFVYHCPLCKFDAHVKCVPISLQHFSDDHPLIFNKVKGAHCMCNGCDENIPDKDSCYSCRKCNVDLHPSCAELPRELPHPLHSKHPLILQKTPPYDEGTCTCKICGEPCKRRRFVYHCPLCKFDAHVKCIPISLQHFSDDHPLIFNKVKGAYCTCNGCDENIPDKNSRYSCRICNFDLHPSCFGLPRELQSPLHSKHPLILHKTPPYDKGTCTCKICGEPCKRKQFVYHCPLCKFDAHVKCASFSLSIETEIHNHPLTLFGKSVTFNCDFCGKENQSMPYLCGGSTCGFWAHRKCASLPGMVKHMRHKHPLILTNSIKDYHSEHRVCQLCVKHVDTNHGIYYCSNCDYVAHLDCATDKNGMDENFMRESKGKESAELTNLLKFEDLELDEFANESS